MKIFAFVVIALNFFLIAEAQVQPPPFSSKNKKAIELYLNADNYRVRGQLDQAIQLLLQALEKDNTFEEAYHRLSLVYRTKGDLKLALKTLEEGVVKTNEITRQKKFWYDLADVMIRQGLYEGVILWSDKFIEAEQKDIKKITQATLWKVQAEYSIANKDKIYNYRITPLSDTVNKYPMQYFPTLVADQSQLIFTARFGVRGNENEDLVVSRKDQNGRWGEPVSISENINTVRREGASTISADGRHMILTICGERGCDLYESQKTGNDWSLPRSLGANVNSTYWDSQPSLSADGRELYFSSDRKGGIGGYDIWYSLREGNGWSKAVNLGNMVNTPFDEVSPYMHVNNKTLYIVSNGYPGYGGYDIYQTEKDSNGWVKPLNMGKPLNDFNDQYSFICDNTGQLAYYSREESKVRSRIYRIEVPGEFVVKSAGNVVKGRVTDRESKISLKSTIELHDIINKKKMAEVLSDSITGEYVIVLPGGSEYGLYVSSVGYVFQSLHFNYKESSNVKPIEIDVNLAKVRKDVTVLLNNIFFDYNMAELKPESIIEIERIKEFLTNNPSVKIRIEGHTDNQGTETYNQQLSLKRARAVLDYLVSTGISPERLSTKGLGSSQPLRPNNSNENRSFNRRIEFRIL